MYMISCDNCGFYDESDFAITKCPNCGHALIIESDTDDEGITDMIENNTDLGLKYIPMKEHINDNKYIENMKKAINKMGDKEVWRVIEDIPNVYDRLYYRKIFFKCQGKVVD